ncbi:MAG: c-type cytochrome [Thermoanaerobaculia bacterium]
MRKPFLVLLILFLASCGKLKELPTAPGGGGGDPIDPTATFTRVQNEIFSPTCGAIGCHDPLGQQEQLILTAGRAYQVVGRPSLEMPQLKIITPLDPANSYLYRKISGSGITGDRMPQGGPYLTDAQIKLIRDWIRRGAPND